MTIALYTQAECHRRYVLDGAPTETARHHSSSLSLTQEVLGEVLAEERFIADASRLLSLDDRSEVFAARNGSEFGF